MDFTNHFNHNPANRPQVPRAASVPEAIDLPPRQTRESKTGKEDFMVRFSQSVSTLLLFIVALLIAALVWLIFVSTPSSQMKYVDPNKLQAVFLNSGQVYFGNVQAINDKYTVLTNIFYLQTNSGSSASTTTQSNQNVTLIKLGCELHAPYDRMIINSNQVTFWENLQSDGQVAKAVTQWQHQNPNGQKCSDQSQAPNPASGLQNQSGTAANSVPTTTTNSTTTTPKH